MCVYCNLGDWAFKHNPPWNEPNPLVPRPINPAPVDSWGLQKLRDYLELLKEIKEMEDKIGCPCVPNKADYLELFKKRIAELEKK